MATHDHEHQHDWSCYYFLKMYLITTVDPIPICFSIRRFLSHDFLCEFLLSAVSVTVYPKAIAGIRMLAPKFSRVQDEDVMKMCSTGSGTKKLQRRLDDAELQLFSKPSRTRTTFTLSWLMMCSTYYQPSSLAKAANGSCNKTSANYFYWRIDEDDNEY